MLFFPPLLVSAFPILSFTILDYLFEFINYLFEIIILFDFIHIFLDQIFIFVYPYFVIIFNLDKTESFINLHLKSFKLLSFDKVINLLFIIFFRFLGHHH